MKAKYFILFLAVALFIGLAIGSIGVYFFKTGVREKASAEMVMASKKKEEGQLETISSESQKPKKERKIRYWQAPMDPTEIYDHPGKSKMGMDLIPVYEDEKAQEKKPPKERKIRYWQAPMDPTEIYDHPGKSKMGMDLIPVYEDEQTLGGGGTISIDPVTVQNMGVKTAKVERRDLKKLIRTVGTIDYDEQKLYRVNPKISGWIEKLYVDYTGKEVKKGDPLLEIYSPELVSTQEEYLLALKNRDMVKGSLFPEIRESAESLLKSSRRRLELWDIPESEIEALEKRGTIVKTMRLSSPTDGVVVHKFAVEGMHVKEGTDLYHIADLST